MTDHNSYIYAKGVIDSEISEPKYVIKQCQEFLENCDSKSEKYFLDKSKL